MNAPRTACLGLAAAALLAAAAATAAPPPPVKAKVTVATGQEGRTDTKEYLLLGISGGNLSYRPPNVPEGVQASLPLAQVAEVNFEIEYDPFEIYKAERERRYAQAAAPILRVVEPVMAFLTLPGNNAADPAFDAAGYLVKTADGQAKLGTPEMQAYAQTNWIRALRLFTNLAEAVWYERAERARVMAAQCLVSLKRYDQAEKVLTEEAREPGAGDGDYGLYWLVRGRLAWGRDDKKGALDAAVRSVGFETKDTTFPEALMLSARCYEDLLEVHRARDVYYEVARLFTTTELGEEARDRLAFLVKSGQLEEKEQANIAKVFFGSEENMDALVKKFLSETTKTNAAPSAPAARPATNAPPAAASEGEKKT